MASKIAGILVGLGVLGAVIFSTLDHVRATCQVCVEFQGRQLCEEASAADRDQAIMQAMNTACVQLSAGVTDGIQCNNQIPLSTQCSE